MEYEDVLGVEEYIYLSQEDPFLDVHIGLKLPN